METTRELFIANITRRRSELGLTQSQAAEKVGVTLGTYQKYEYGTAFPSPETMDEIAKALKCKLWELLGRQDSPPSPLRPVGEMSIEELRKGLGIDKAVEIKMKEKTEAELKIEKLEKLLTPEGLQNLLSLRAIDARLALDIATGKFDPSEIFHAQTESPRSSSQKTPSQKDRVRKP